MNTFSLKILAADKVFYQGLCQSLIIPTADGQYGIQANHENEIAAVWIGIAKFTDRDGVRHRAVLSEGICMIENNKVTVLVETAERPDEIDRLEAEREAKDARQAMEHRQNVTDARRAQAKMVRAMSRIRAKDQTEID